MLSVGSAGSAWGGAAEEGAGARRQAVREPGRGDPAGRHDLSLATMALPASTPSFSPVPRAVINPINPPRKCISLPKLPKVFGQSCLPSGLWVWVLVGGLYGKDLNSCEKPDAWASLPALGVFQRVG